MVMVAVIMPAMVMVQVVLVLVLFAMMNVVIIKVNRSMVFVAEGTTVVVMGVQVTAALMFVVMVT